MTVARGLFRLWVVFSALWIAGVAWREWREGLFTEWHQKPPFDPSRPYQLPGGEWVVPPEFAQDAPTIPLPPGWVEKQRLIEIERKRLNEIVARENISATAKVALLPPAFFLILGTGLIWAIRGFRP